MEKEGTKNDALQWQFLGVIVGRRNGGELELSLYVGRLFDESILGVGYQDKIFLAYEKEEGSYSYSFETKESRVLFNIPKRLEKALGGGTK